MLNGVLPARNGTGGADVGVFLDHRQIGVQRNPDGGVEGYLECRPHVLGPDHRVQLLAVYHLLHLLEDLRKLLDLLLSLTLQIQFQSFPPPHHLKVALVCSALWNCQRRCEDSTKLLSATMWIMSFQS